MNRATPAQQARASQAAWGPPPRASSPSRMALLSWEPASKAGALLGRAKVKLPNGLEIARIGLFQRADGVRWAQLPSEIMRDAEGQPLKDDHGKIRYQTAICWSTSALQDRFSEALFALVEASAGTAGEARQQAPAVAQPKNPGLARVSRRGAGPTHRVETGPDLPPLASLVNAALAAARCKAKRRAAQ